MEYEKRNTGRTGWMWVVGYIAMECIEQLQQNYRHNMKDRRERERGRTDLGYGNADQQAFLWPAVLAVL